MFADAIRSASRVSLRLLGNVISVSDATNGPPIPPLELLERPAWSRVRTVGAAGRGYQLRGLQSVDVHDAAGGAQRRAPPRREASSRLG